MALGHLKLDVVAGEKNPADTLTKPLPGRKNPRMVRTCWSEMVAAITTTTTTNDGRNIAMDAW